MSYVERLINLTFQLGTGAFGADGSNTVKLVGLRVVANITKGGTLGYDSAQVRVYGVDPTIMNKLSTVGFVVAARHDVLTIEAGDAVSGMSVIFSGYIFDAYMDGLSAPEVPFVVICHNGWYPSLKPVPATSYKGPRDVATLLSGMAQQAGYTFENQGVQQLLTDGNHPGTALDQIKDVCEHAGINYKIDGFKLVIWPKGGTLGGQMLTISPSTGLVGYPAYNIAGPLLTVLFTPGLLIGTIVNVQSSITQASGMWYVVGIAYELTSKVAGGPWFMRLQCKVQQFPGGPSVSR